MSEVIRKRVAQLLCETPGVEVLAKGWVRTKRGNKNVAFIALNDGSTVNNIQVVCDAANFSDELLKDITTGACIAVKGTLVESMGKGQSVEIQAKEIEIYGKADVETYPLQKKGHSMEFLREIAHLRPRTNTFGCVLRIRHAMAYAIHKYFNDKGFCYLHTPLITASDCEGAGAMFQVTTMDLNNVPKTEEGKVDFSNLYFQISPTDVTYPSLEAAKAAGAVTLNYGAFINNVISFLIVACAVFAVIKAINTLKNKVCKEEVVEAEATTKECPFCCSTIAINAKRCPNCTSEL